MGSDALCTWCKTGKPLWVKEGFKNPRCKNCQTKPDGLRSPTEILADHKKVWWKETTTLKRKKRARPDLKIIRPDRRLSP